MDVTKPGVEWIDGICYRLNTTAYSSQERGRQPYEEEDSCPMEQLDDCGSEDDEDIEEISNGQFRVNFHVAWVYFSYLVGAKGSTKKRLEAETQTRINIPKPGQAGDIIVTGSNRRSVRSAKSRILVMVSSVRKRSHITHFLSVACNVPSVQKEFLAFKEVVLNKCAARGIEELLFQKPEKLHITICVLVLGDEIEQKQAVNALEKCKEDVLRPLISEPLEIEIRGVEIMNDDPSAVNVLYGKVTCPSHPTVFQTMCDNVCKYFIDGGLVGRTEPQVKLHVTLMNSSFCCREEGAAKKKRPTFDATEIMKVFQEFHFGTVTVSKIDLSKLASYDASGYYTAVASIPIA